VIVNSHLQHVRLRIALGDLERAWILLQHEPRPSLALTWEEFIAYRALLAASRHDVGEAELACKQVATSGNYVFASTICELSAAIIDVQRSGEGAARRIVSMIERATRSGHLDALITACRAYPDLARVAANHPPTARMLTSAFLRSRDIDLGRSVGLEMPRELRREGTLSAREQEIYELLVQGRSNREIAKTLFISESTTKVHVRHIFEKLGVHTRAEAARAAVDRTRD
jgi:DNA-binding CsgD family transcriptional regulator